MIPLDKEKEKTELSGKKKMDMEYSINMGSWNSVFAVPSCVVDEHMKLAGGAQLKVLLYLLRHSNERVSLDTLAFAIGQKPSDTQDALDYWVNCGLMSDSPVQSKQKSPDTPADQTVEPVAPEQANIIPEAEIKNALEMTPEKKAPVTREKIRYPFDECMKYVAEDEQLKNMLTAKHAHCGGSHARQAADTYRSDLLCHAFKVARTPLHCHSYAGAILPLHRQTQHVLHRGHRNRLGGGRNRQF